MLYATAASVFAAWWSLGDRQPRYVMTAIVLLLPLASWLTAQTVGALRASYEVLLSVGVLTMALVLIVRIGAENGSLLVQFHGAARHDVFEYPALLDHLPADSVVANGVDRAVSYSLLGEGLHNHVVDLAEIDSRFSSDHGTRFHLDRAGIAKLGITHFYIDEQHRVDTDRCVELSEVDRIDRNPFNGKRYASARVLYSVRQTCSE